MKQSIISQKLRDIRESESLIKFAERHGLAWRTLYRLCDENAPPITNRVHARVVTAFEVEARAREKAELAQALKERRQELKAIAKRRAANAGKRRAAN